MNGANTSNRSKQERRDRAWAYKGNVQVIDQVFRPVGHVALYHPNRVMQRWRESFRPATKIRSHAA